MDDAETAFYEGDPVGYTGPLMPPAHGRVLHFASARFAYVKWTDGPKEKDIDLIDVYDLQPLTAAQQMAINPRTAVKVAMASDGAAGVINYLASASELGEWPDIAVRVMQFAAELVRQSESMEKPHEQLDSLQFEAVVDLGARVLLRDAFGQLVPE